MSVARITPIFHLLVLECPIAWNNPLQNRDHPLPVLPAHLLHELNARNQIARATRSEEQAIVVDNVPRHRYGLGVGYAEGVVDDVKSECHVVRKPIDAAGQQQGWMLRKYGLNMYQGHLNIHSLDDCIDLMSSLSPLGLLRVEHNSKFDLPQPVSLPLVIFASESMSQSEYRTLLYKPLPSGSVSTTRTYSFIDFKNWPVPEIVPPVPLSFRQ